eukprot:jgi/Chrzof1/1840/Cz10g23090.t1_PPD8[v5.2]
MAADAEALQHRSLFGGAIEVCLPARFVDISDVRPVPNNQEVFADANRDQSFVVEIVEHSPVSDDAAGRFVFEDLAAANNATHSAIEEIRTLGPEDMPHMPENYHKCLVRGTQDVSKSREGPAAVNRVQLLVALIRLPDYESDIIITLNTPVFISQYSSSAQLTGSGAQAWHEDAPALFQAILKTFKINDYDVFGV